MPAPATARIPLDRARVIAAAIDAADADGLAALSMRGLATRLGVVPMALYKHVADKDDLVAGMIDAVVAGFAAPAADLGARDSITARIAAARAAVGRHPWLRGAIEAATSPTPTVLAHMDAVAGDLFRSGLSADLVHHAMHALGSRIWGFSPEAFTAPTGGPDPETATPDAETRRAMAERYPHVAAVAADAASRHPSGACVADAEFDFTLDLLLDAVERLHAAGWRSGVPRAST
ncbi:TetR family transcriptional regulator [Microbacterium sp. LjRoot45]|uniref:TetR/AcrR family transcriptional regulator n=1 Tax=Microbacterium sp. LjRoot45 TaxID=3342329 RepID=UPI003ECF1FA8